MITLDTNLILLSKYYELNTKRTNPNAYKSIEETTDAQATQKTSNNNDVKEINYEELIKQLELENPKNRLTIIQLMKRGDVLNLLFLLDKKNLLIGLKFFNKKKILRFLYELPKSDLIDILKQIFSNKELLSFMSIKELSNFLSSSKIKHGDLLKIVKQLPPSLLQQIIEAATGRPAQGKSNAALYGQIAGMRQEQLVKGIKGLPYAEILNFVNKLTLQNPDLLKVFKKVSLMKPLINENKGKIIQSMQVLEPDVLIKMLGKLPDNLLTQVATMIEPDKFAHVLTKYFTNILDQLVA